MLKHTFCHLAGIGEKTEAQLWATGLQTIEQYAIKFVPQCSGPKSEVRRNQLLLWLENYKSRNIHYFANELESKHLWRLYWDFRDKCAFVDIETTGFGKCEITTIVLYDGNAIRHYVNGVNLDQFKSDVQAYSLLVTYCGKRFDIPMIESYFKIRIPHAHIDLVSPLRSIGLKGGLKGCERQLGIARDGLEGVQGDFAVQLWDDFKLNNNADALETLLAYNVHDTISLHQMMVHLHNQKLQQTPFSKLYLLPSPERHANPFCPHQPTIERIKSSQMNWDLPNLFQ